MGTSFALLDSRALRAGDTRGVAVLVVAEGGGEGAAAQDGLGQGFVGGDAGGVAVDGGLGVGDVSPPRCIGDRFRRTEVRRSPIALLPT